MKYKGVRTANAALVFTLLLKQAEVTIADYKLRTSKEDSPAIEAAVSVPGQGGLRGPPHTQAWGSSMKYKSVRTANAALVFTLLLKQAEVTIANYELRTSEKNSRTDRLSRQQSVPQVRKAYEDLEDVRELVFPEEVLAQILRDCNPRAVYEDDAAFCALWKWLLALKDLVQGGGEQHLV
jgi:hypothetical protein